MAQGLRLGEIAYLEDWDWYVQPSSLYDKASLWAGLEWLIE